MNLLALLAIVLFALLAASKARKELGGARKGGLYRRKRRRERRTTKSGLPYSIVSETVDPEPVTAVAEPRALGPEEAAQFLEGGALGPELAPPLETASLAHDVEEPAAPEPPERSEPASTSQPASEAPRSAPATPSVPRAPAPQALAAELFDASLPGFEAERVFGERYHGARARWRGVVERVENPTAGPRVTARVEAQGARAVSWICALPAGVAPPETGEAIEVQGTLESCDPYLRAFSLVDGTLLT